MPSQRTDVNKYLECMKNELPGDILWIFYFIRMGEFSEEVKVIKRRVLNELRENTITVRSSLDAISDPEHNPQAVCRLKKQGFLHGDANLIPTWSPRVQVVRHRRLGTVNEYDPDLGIHVSKIVEYKEPTWGPMITRKILVPGSKVDRFLLFVKCTRVLVWLTMLLPMPLALYAERDMITFDYSVLFSCSLCGMALLLVALLFDIQFRRVIRISNKHG